MNSDIQGGEEGDLVFCRYFRHPRTGKIVYPKNSRFFVFRAKARGKRQQSKQLELPLTENQQKKNNSQ